MKSKAWIYPSLLTILALLITPAMAQSADLTYTNDNQRVYHTSGSSNQAVLRDINSTQITIQVTSLQDNTVVDGFCTLREALQAANTHSAVDSCQAGSEIDNIITFSITGTITLVGDDLDVNTVGGSLVIDGGGGITVSGGNIVRVFTVGNLANVKFKNLSIIDGHASEGGGIYNNGSVNIQNSTLSSNEASGENGRGGGIYNNSGTLSITNSLLSGNHASSGGAIYNNSSYMAIANSTLSGNFVVSEGGGIYSTGDLALYNATVADNIAGTLGGGIYIQSNTLYLSSTILTENSSGTNGPDCYVTTVNSYGYNLVGNTAGCGINPWTGDLTNVSPLLDSLQDNGGPTYTHALLPMSLAIDHGNRNGCSFFSTPLTTDQRGFPRVGRCDIGAYEWQTDAAGPYRTYLPCISRACTSQLFFDDFSNPSSGWRVFEDAFERVEYLNNEYRILAKSVPAWISSFTGFSATNYVASVDVRNASDVNGYAGILFGFAPDWSHFYFFVVNNTGRFVILQFDQVTSKWIANGYSNAIHLHTEPNHLRVERNGDMIWAYANGELLTIVKDDSYTGLGYVGLITVADTDPGVDARFDNFTVEPISCGASYNYPLLIQDAYDMNTVKLAPPE